MSSTDCKLDVFGAIVLVERNTDGWTFCAGDQRQRCRAEALVVRID